MLEDAAARGKRRVDVAAPQMKVERDVGAALALEVLEVGKRPGRLQHVVDDGLRGHRLDLVEHRRQLVIFRVDQLHRRVGDVRIGREHDRDRLADMAHLVDGEDRLVVEGRPVIGLGDDGLDVVGGDDALDAGQAPRRPRRRAA